MWLLIGSAILALWSAFVVIIALFHLDCGLYFENDRVNAIMFIAGLLATWVCAALQFALWPKTVYFSFISVPICVLATLIAGLSWIESFNTLATGIDLGREKIESANLSQFHRLNCYRTNGGATTDYGVIVCDEWVALGLKWSHSLYSEYHCSEAEIHRVGEKRFRVILHVTGSDVEHVIQF